MPFKKGESGNPAGRPRGLGDRRERFRKLVEPHSEALVLKAVDLALEGDVQTLRFLLDRLLPAKPKDESIDAGPYTGSALQQSDEIQQALYAGRITPSEASALMQTTIGALKVREYEDLEKRLEALEGRAGVR